MTKDEKRKVLLQVASEVLMELGAHKTTLDDIARRAGMAKTSLYYYFRDKNELIRAIIQSYTEQLVEIMTSAAAGENTAEGKMYALIESRYLFIAERAGRASKEIIQEFRALEGVFETEKELYLQAHMDLVRGILEYGISKGEIGPMDNLDLISLIVISSMFGCDRTLTFYKQPDNVLDAMKQMNKIFFSGLRNVG